MRNNTKFVAFSKFCGKCKHVEKPQEEEPCNTCLETGAREGTWKPEKFEEKEES